MDKKNYKVNLCKLNQLKLIHQHLWETVIIWLWVFLIIGGYICEMWISTHIVPTGQKLRNNKEVNLVQLLFIPLPIFLPKSEIWV